MTSRGPPHSTPRRLCLYRLAEAGPSCAADSLPCGVCGNHGNSRSPRMVMHFSCCAGTMQTLSTRKPHTHVHPACVRSIVSISGGGSEPRGFPDGSDGKESACNAGDLGSILGLGRSPGEGIGYSLQYSWVYLMAQMVKTLSAMQETRVQSLGRENHLEMATHSSILAWRIPWTEEAGGLQSMWSQRCRED